MRGISQSVLAAVAGIGALYAYERLEARGLGRTPLYALPSLEARLRGVSPRHARALAHLFRAAYGPGWGALYGLAVRSPRLGHAVPFALTIYGVELALMPPFRAAPPLRDWPRAELATLLGHILAFSITTTAVRVALR